MKRIFYFSSLIILVLFLSSCGRKLTVASTNWHIVQEYPVSKYLDKTEEELAQSGLSGKLYMRDSLNFLSESEAEVRIILSGTIYVQLNDSAPKDIYKNVYIDENVKMTYTYKQPNGVLAAEPTKYWHQPTTKFTIHENAVYLILVIDNQDVIFQLNYFLKEE